MPTKTAVHNLFLPKHSLEPATVSQPSNQTTNRYADTDPQWIHSNIHLTIFVLHAKANIKNMQRRGSTLQALSKSKDTL